MASNKTIFRPGSKPAWRKRIAAVTQYIGDLETCLAQANSALVPQPVPRDKAMNDVSDVVWKVISKLSTLDDFFALYWSSIDKVGIQKEAITGLSFIIADCVSELKEAVEWDK
jgi:hypothetical protein